MSKYFFYLLVLLSVITGKLSAQYPCINDTVSYNGIDYPCQNIDLLAHMPTSAISPSSPDGNDIWGWTHPSSGREFVIMGLTTGTSFIEITDPVNPVYVGFLPSHVSQSQGALWRDMKTYQHYVFIVSEQLNHGMQVFDLNRLMTTASKPIIFTEDAHLNFRSFGGRSHNIVGLTETGYMVLAGARDSIGCNSGLEFINVQNPLQPVYEGCFGTDGYSHDAVCFVYKGPDADYLGKEICVGSNEDTQTFVDVSDKAFPEEISKVGYAKEYTHQGWVSDDHRFLVFNDELDESRKRVNTRTHFINMEDLDNPIYLGFYSHDVRAIDHNCFVHGQYIFEANYRSGLRILNFKNLTNDPANEVFLEAHFDTYPTSNTASFNGSWGVYPYFSSGTIAVSNIEDGLFLLKLTSPGFVMNYSQETKALCDGDNTMKFKIGIQSYGGYSDPVTLSTTNLPLGVTAEFDTNPANPGDTVTLTLTGTSSLNGTFNINVAGEGPGNNAEHQFVLAFNTIPSIPTTLAFTNQSFAADETYAARDMIQLDNVSIDNNVELTLYAPMLEVNNDLNISGGGMIRWINENQCDQE